MTLFLTWVALLGIGYVVLSIAIFNVFRRKKIISDTVNIGSILTSVALFAWLLLLGTILYLFFFLPAFSYITGMPIEW